jgi:norsolorinic acid ketoreductase
MLMPFVQGIGRGLADALLKRPHHVVIAAVRDPSSASAVSLRDSPTADGSKVILVKIESTSEADPAEAVKSIQTQGITALDIVIANAGISGSYARVDAINVADMREMFEVNTLPVVSLFKAVYPLLQKSKNAKFVAITTNGASIVDMEENIPFILGSYGVSKAAVNYLTRRIHFENDWLTTFVINPG